MEPRENPNFLSRFNAVEALDKSRMDFQSCIGRALPSLTGSAGALLEGGVYIADRRNIEALWDIHNSGAKMDRNQPYLNHLNLRPAARRKFAARPALVAAGVS